MNDQHIVRSRPIRVRKGGIFKGEDHMKNDLNRMDLSEGHASIMLDMKKMLGEGLAQKA